MEENSKLGVYSAQVEQEEKSSFDFSTIYTIFLFNWKWFILSLAVCVGIAYAYLRQATPVYQAYAKYLIKNETGNSRNSRSMLSTTNLGIVSNATNINNEMEILKSRILAEQTVRDLKLYVTYVHQGRIRNYEYYRNQPVSVDIDPAHLEKLTSPIDLEITRVEGGYAVSGSFYYVPEDNPTEGKTYSINKTLETLPATINSRVGTLTFNANSYIPMQEGQTLTVQIKSPLATSYKYAGSLQVAQLSELTTIASLVLTDEIPLRAIDYLRQLTVCYNRQANDEKNEVARRTEAFINSRLEKINAELGDAEGSIEDYKRRNNMIDVTTSAGTAMSHQDDYGQRLIQADVQLELLNSIEEYMDDPVNKYQAIPVNVGLSDPTALSLINRYNEIALERNRILGSASESSPVVTPLTAQLDDLSNGIKRSLEQTRRNMQIERNSLSSQYSKYTSQISSTPEQERILSQIGRQQTVKSGLYLALLQKREENSISLAATADNGQLIDEPQFAGKVSPENTKIMLVAVVLGIMIPLIIFLVRRLMRYKIEGHDDVASLTDIPIIADVPVATDKSKGTADIVVRENQNTQMEETFRSLRTNLQFMFKEGHKVAMFTSSTSGEGKTFNVTNLAMSFALLEKKVIIVGLDIRKPRIAEQFGIHDHHHGITNLLATNEPTVEMVKEQIIPSGINNNLDLLMSGPIPPNPTELLSRKSLDATMAILKELYDYVFIDTAPIGLVTDTFLLGRVADATVFVCRADYTPKRALSNLNALNTAKRLPEIGIVINGIDMSKKKYGYYYGYSNYKSYGRYSYSPGTYFNSKYGQKNDTSVKR